MTQDNTEHVIDKDLVTQLEDEFKVWAYVMTQYNLKPGLRKFGKRGVTAAVNKLTQFHIMDTWTAMDPSKISREEQMKALSSLLFLKEKRTEGSRDEPVSMVHHNRHTYPRKKQRHQRCRRNQHS